MSETEFEKITLERFKVYSCKAIPPMTDTEFLRMLDFQVRRSDCADELIMSLWSYVLCEKFEPVTESCFVTMPKTWWNHFKMTHFPEWLLRFFPYETKTEQVSLTCVPRAVYPKMPMIQGGGARIMFFTAEGGRRFVDEHGKDETDR